MRATPAHHAVVCSACGLRFPVPVDDDRYGTCPLCEAPTTVAADYPKPVAPPNAASLESEIVVVLDNVRSAMNVGTILRTADGARVAHAYLCGITPSGDNPKVAKTALDAERLVSWSHHVDAVECCRSLAADGYELWAVEATPGSVDYLARSAPARVAVIVGNERAGIDPGVLALADQVIHLPMAGAKTSLNVAVAFGVAAYGLRANR